MALRNKFGPKSRRLFEVPQMKRLTRQEKSSPSRLSSANALANASISNRFPLPTRLPPTLGCPQRKRKQKISDQKRKGLHTESGELVVSRCRKWERRDCTAPVASASEAAKATNAISDTPAAALRRSLQLRREAVAQGKSPRTKVASATRFTARIIAPARGGT